MFGWSLQEFSVVWITQESRPYMRARFAVVEAGLALNTFDAVKSSLNHLLDMLRLDRDDTMDLRGLISHLMLQLGRAQDCYGFIKERARVEADGAYDWADMTSQSLNLKNADIYGEVDFLCNKYPIYNHSIAATLLKIRLLPSLTNYRASALIQWVRIRATQVDRRLPAEIVNHIRSDVLTAVTIGNLNGRDPTIMMTVLKAQVQQLYDWVQKKNQSFWPVLLNPDRYLASRPPHHGSGSGEQMQRTLRYSHDAWEETPGALAYIQMMPEK